MEIFIEDSAKKHSEDSVKKPEKCHEHYEGKVDDICDTQKRWSEIPYPGECEVPDGLDSYAGSWPTFFFKWNEKGILTTSDGDPVCFDIKDPDDIDFKESLKTVKHVQKNLTKEQRVIAEYWGEGPATKQWTPVIDRLIDTYGLSPAAAGRVLAAVHAGINDAFVITWYFKYLWYVPRPIQLDRRLATAICTPYFPSYPSGHSVISGVAEVILSYFFPAEADRLRELAEENGISRLLGGVHFLEDITEGLRLGRQIGRIVVDELSKQRDIKKNPIDDPVIEDLHAKLTPPPYRQDIPYCPLRVRECDLPLIP